MKSRLVGTGEGETSTKPSQKRSKSSLLNFDVFRSPVEGINDTSPWRRDFRA
jgi:hypothetical protein